MKVKKRVGGLIIIGQLISSMPPCCRLYIAAGNIWWPCASSTCSSTFAMGQSTIRWPRLVHLLCRLANMTSEPVHPKQLWSDHLKPRKKHSSWALQYVDQDSLPNNRTDRTQAIIFKDRWLWFPTGNYSCPKVKAPQLFFCAQHKLFETDPKTNTLKSRPHRWFCRWPWRTGVLEGKHWRLWK